MSETFPSQAPEAENSVISVAQKQASLGAQWAAIYSNPAIAVDPNAETILSNPSLYLNGIELNKLPEDLDAKWHSLLDFSEALVAIAGHPDIRWGDVNGIGKLQSLVASNSIDPAFRGSVGDVIRLSSNLFAESSPYEPGDTRFYANKIHEAEKELSKHS